MAKLPNIWLPMAALLALVLSVWPESANAQAIVGSDVCPGDGLTSRVVLCVVYTVQWATTNFLLPLSQLVAHLVLIACTLAVLLFGINMLVNRSMRITSEAIILALKISLVIVFTYNFGGMYPVLLQTIVWMIDSVSAYTTVSVSLACPYSGYVWAQVDCALDRIIGGIMPGSMLTFGLIGFIAGSLFAGPAGLSLFLIGTALVIMVLLALFKAAYIYMSAVIGLAMMVLVSPFFIPLMLFRVTTAYFQKWLRLVIALVLQPIFLFVYLTMLLAAFDVVIFSGPNSLYATIAGPSATAPNFRIGSYLLASGGFEMKDQMEMNLALHPNEVAAAIGDMDFRDTGMFSRLGGWSNPALPDRLAALDRNMDATFPVQAVNIVWLAELQNMDMVTYVVRVTLALLMATIIAYIFYVMLEFVPYLGLAMTAEVMSLPDLGGGADNLMKGLQSKLAPRPVSPSGKALGS